MIKTRSSRLQLGDDGCPTYILWATRVDFHLYKRLNCGLCNGLEIVLQNSWVIEPFGGIQPYPKSALLAQNRPTNPIYMSCKLHKNVSLVTSETTFEWLGADKGGECFQLFLKIDFCFGRSWMGIKQRGPILVPIKINIHIIYLVVAHEFQSWERPLAVIVDITIPSQTKLANTYETMLHKHRHISQLLVFDYTNQS